VILVAGLVLLGWVLRIEALESGLPGLATMKVNSACAFGLAGFALWRIHLGEPGSRSVRLARAIALGVAGVGVLTLFENMTRIDLGIDQLLMPDSNPQGAHGGPQGRMSPATAVSFIFLGLSLACLKSLRPKVAACAQWLAMPVLLVSVLALVGYAYGVNSLYEVRPYASMAVHTAGCLLILIASLLAADPAHGIANIASSSSAGGVMVRRLLPALCLALFVLGRLGLAGQQAGLYDFRFGMALMVLASCAVSAAAVSLTAMTLRKVDLTRRRAEAQVTVLNAGLERRVEERTRELARVSADLAAANVALEQLSLHDGLTGLANRRYFDAHLATQMAIMRRQRRGLALVLCDIDVFKAFNDEYGHQAGDECLKKVAAALRSCCRRPADMAARYGGEEFALILPETDLRGAQRIAEAAREAVAKLRIPHGPSAMAPHVTISGGISATQRKVDFTVERLIAGADAALYQAKAEGRDRIATLPVQPIYQRA